MKSLSGAGSVRAFDRRQFGLVLGGSALLPAAVGSPGVSGERLTVQGTLPGGGLMFNVKDFGGKGDGTTDDTPAIQAAIDAAHPGATIYFPGTGSGAWYRVTSSLIISKSNIRFLGQPRDGYAVSIRPSAPNIAVIVVKHAGFVFQDMAVLGDGGVSGEGATVTGIDLYGSTNSDVDCLIVGGTIQGCLIGALVRGRNADIARTLFSNCVRAVVIDGQNAFHVGAGASTGNRGNTIRNCRFHGTGSAAIEVTTTAKVRHMLIAGNYFDSNGNGSHVRATGTSTFAHEKLTIRDNKSAEVSAVVYSLTYVNNSTIDGIDIMGNTTVINNANGLELNNCNTVIIRNVFGVQLGGSGVYARNCTSLLLENVKWRVLGMGIGPAAHGFDIDATNARCSFDAIRVEKTDGWGFNGSPADSTMANHEFVSCTLGGINSSTLLSRAGHGRNVYIEGAGGRKQDYASKPFDLATGVATPLATIVANSSYCSFEVEVKVIGRNATGQLYGRYIRYVRPENGAPQYLTPVADVALGTLTVAFSASGTSGVSVSATVTGSPAFVTAHVTALAGGGASGANARGVTVRMA
jgi:hypothetical protein